MPATYAYLRVGPVRCDVREFSAAGLTLQPHHAARGGLDVLARGEQRCVTLCLGTLGGETNYEVAIRRATARSEAAEFAFVGLPPGAQRLLRESVEDGTEDDPDGEQDSPFAASGPAPFAFARADEEPTDRRLALAMSDAVLSHTQQRSDENGECPDGADQSGETDKHRAVENPTRDENGNEVVAMAPIPAALLYAYGISLLVLTALCIFKVTS